ncbi:MAG: leucine-rich repeat protein [Prevotella sp.]|nr:leucine-rich repeat protein [Prevotella sp.]
MKTRHFLMMATLAVGIAMTSMMMTSCAKEDNPVDTPEEMSGEGMSGASPGAGGGSLVDGDWTYSISDNDVILTGFNNPNKATWIYLSIPVKVDNKYVTYIATPYGVDFSEFKKLKRLIFDKDCRIDEMPSVRGCSTLQNIYFGNVADKLPNSMKTVKSFTFDGTAIKKIDFNQVNSVGDKVFRDCNSLESVNIPNTDVSLGEEVFAYIPSKCTVSLECSLKKLTWKSVSFSPQIIVKCSDGAMGWCGDGGDSPQDFLYWTYKNETLTIACARDAWSDSPDKQNIRTHRWQDYTTATKTLVLSDVYAIGDELFKDMVNLQSMTLNDGLKNIGNDAFSGCLRLENFTLPTSVTSIGKRAFENCKSLTSITIPASVKVISAGVFRGCTSLESITIPASVTSIEVSVFQDCTSLESVTIPASVTYIGINAFRGCTSLESVTIPASVTSIRDYAFADCTSLKEVIIEGNPTIGEGAFPEGVKITYEQSGK